MTTIEDVRQRRSRVWTTMRDILDEAGGDGLEGDALKRWRQAEADFDKLDAEIADIERTGSGGLTVEDMGYQSRSSPVGARLVGPSGSVEKPVRDGRALPPDGSFSTLPGAGYSGADRESDFGRVLRATITGEWQGVPDELRVQSEGTDSEGGYMVPTPLSAQVLDLARNQMVTAAAGTQIVPFSSKTFGLPIQTGDAQPVWRTEAAAIDEDSITLGKRELDAKSAAVLVKASWELMEDASQLGTVVTGSLAKAFAVELDRVVLRGSGVDPEPEGLRNHGGVTVTSLAAVPTYDTLVEGVRLVKAQNYQPTAQILSTREEATLGKLKGSTNDHYLEPPAYLADVPRLATNQIPTNLGTGSSKSEIYTGDFQQVALGIRTSFRVIPLRERYADHGQVAWIGWVRADVVVLRPEAFHIYSNVQLT